MNILLVDDAKSNISLLKLLVEDWLDDNDIDIDKIIIEEAYDGQEAVNKIEQTYYDIVFLDIMMPVMDGLEALVIIRNTLLEKQPNIVMQTALDKGETKTNAQKFGANAYITKPINSKMVGAMLDRYIDKSLLVETNEEEDDFMDFDDFDDFDDFTSDEMDTQKDMMDKFNASHRKVPATVFLEDYPDLEYVLEDLEELDESVYEITEHIIGVNLEDNIIDVNLILDRYSQFLNTFMDFYELSTSLVMLKGVLDNVDYSIANEKNKDFIALYLKAILTDLTNWKEHVFISKDAIDVFYINASSLNSCIQLESYIKSLH